jgi:hypothetical protein
MLWWNNNQRNKQILGLSGNPGVLMPAPMTGRKPVALIIALSVAVVLIIGLAVFGVWTYKQMLDYKNNSDEKAVAAVQQAEAEQKATLEAQFDEQEKSPLKSYTSPAAYGSVNVVYPKTWSAYISETSTSSGVVVDGFFYPDYLPSVGTSDTTNFSLRLQIFDGSYQAIVDQYQAQIKQGKLTAVPYTATLVEGASIGVKLTGQFTQTKRGAMVIVPLRDKILKIWTETEGGVADFDNYVIANLTFSP